jgi:hypothetical protein
MSPDKNDHRKSLKKHASISSINALEIGKVADFSSVSPRKVNKRSS